MIVLKNHGTVAAQAIAQLNIHLENTVSTKSVRCEFHKSSIHGRAAIAKPLITESNAHMCKRWCQTIKPRYQTTGNVGVIWLDELSFTLFPTAGRVYVWRTPEEVYNPECLVVTVKHEGGILLIPLLPFMAKLLQGSI
jgi:hypothetical protein